MCNYAKKKNWNIQKRKIKLFISDRTVELSIKKHLLVYPEHTIRKFFIWVILICFKKNDKWYLNLSLVITKVSKKMQR